MRMIYTAQPEITGETSDGYHTFNELYHHRAVLFSVICNDRPALAWKSKLHHDGTMYDGMFIVGIETPEGQATYHYDVNPYWAMFRVSELPQAPEWDGHTPAQAIERIGKLVQPESSRQRALRTGVCPMCEDCPDGCPIETPKDSRNIVTNADRIRGMSDEELARQNVRKRRGYCVWTTSDGREFTSYLGFGGVYRADEDTIALAVQHELDWLRQPAETEGTE